MAGRHETACLSVGPATRGSFAGAVAHACGQELVGDSLVIVVGPSPYSDQVSHLYFVDRLGHPLVYFQATRRSQFPTMALERTPLGCVK